MPLFRVKSPDGKTYNVNAPAGTTPAQAAAYAQKKFAPKRTKLQTVADFIGDTVDNITPNWADEISANGALVGAKLGWNGRDPKTAFADRQREFHAEQKSYDKAHPKLAWTSTLAGTGIGLAAPVGKVKAVAAVPKIARAVTAAKVGGIYGALSGTGQEQGQGRVVNGVKGAAIGATVGAVIPSVGDGAQKAGRFIRANVPGVDPLIRGVGNVPRRVMGLPPVPPSARPAAHADRMLAERMGQGDIQLGMGQHGPAATPANVADEVSRRADMGVPAMPADVSEPLRQVTSWASRGTGPGQTAVRHALNARKATEGARVRDHVTSTMGPAVDPIAAVADNLAASKVAAAPRWREAYELPTQITPEMARIMRTPAFRDAVPQAVKNIQNDMGDPLTMGFMPDGHGNFIQPAEGVFSTEAFDQIVRAMKQSARSAGDINPLTGAVQHNSNSVGINARAGDLSRELTAQNAPLDQAISGYADEAAHRQAMQAGADVGKLTGHEVNAQARALPVDAHPSFAQGARTALADQASTFGAKFPNGDTAMAVNKSLGDPTKQAAIEAIDGNRGAIPALQSRLEAEHQGNIVHKSVLGNSSTADKLALDGEMNEASGKLTSFTLPGVARATWNFIADKASTPYRNEVKARIAQVVTETNPATVRELMAEIANRAQTDRDFADLMQKSGVIAAGAYGGKIKADDE
jgi:hypothetical protein